MYQKKKFFKSSVSLMLACSVCVGNLNVAAFAGDTAEADIKWSGLYGAKGTNSMAATCDSINDVLLRTNDSYVAVGAFDGNGVSGVEGQKGKTDATLLLYQSSGELDRQVLVGGSKADYFYKVAETDLGGFVAVGATQSSDGDLDGISKGGYDGLVTLFDSEGNVEKNITIGGSSKDELRDIMPTFDGGYIVTGYTQSNDGDIANAGKTATDRDALIVKLNQELEIEWLQTYGVEGTVTTGLDDFYAVALCFDGGYIAVGGTGISDGVIGKNKDICIVKYSERGEIVWEKTYGGSGDDYATGIAIAPYDTDFSGEDDAFSDISVVETGFVLTGTTNSRDGIFEKSETDEEISKAFILKINAEGMLEKTEVLENTVGTTGEDIIPVSDGYMITGSFEANDLDFTGADVYGKKDFYAAHYSVLGNLLNMTTYGSDDDDVVKGITLGNQDDYVLYGNTKSTSFYENSLQGKYDGFLLCADKTYVETYAEEKFLVPVKAWKEKADEVSMMSPLLYKDAYVEKTGEQYRVTVYFTNATMMGTQILASTLGAASYEQNGTMVAADVDKYDILTQVKQTTITIGSLEEPVKFQMEGMMGIIRLAFEEEHKVLTETPPYFPQVEVTRPDFEHLWKTNVGGSDVDYANAMTVMNNGNVIVVGQGYSNDGDFEGMLSGFSGGYTNIYQPDGTLLKTIMLCGANQDSSAYTSGVAAAKDGGFFISGGYQENFGRKPSGDFAELNVSNGVYGQIDGFYAKYDEHGNQVWMKNFSGSAYDQIKQILATDDGGCVILIETNSEDGDMEGLSKGIFDLVLVKCDSDGKEQWKKVISGSSMQSASMGTAVLQDGSYIVGGYAYLGYTFGDFEDFTHYGNTFDLFLVKIGQEGELIWAKSYGGEGNDYANAVTATSDGGFLFAGSTKSTTGTFEETGTSYENPFIIKCNADGEIEWCDVLKSTEKGENIKAIELEDRYVVVGSSYGMDFDFANLNKGNRDVFVAYYEKNGTRTYLETIGGINLDYAVDIAALSESKVGLLLDGASTDGDFSGLNRGENDGTLLVFEIEELKTADKSQLEALLETAKKIDNADGRYTETTFRQFEEALKVAEAVYEDKKATEAEVTAQIEALKQAMEQLREVTEEGLDKNKLADGTYTISAYMYKTDGKTYSMANNAIAHKVLLEVKDGKYSITMQLTGLAMYGMSGYLSDLEYYEDGYTLDENGNLTGNTTPAEVISTQKDENGKDIVDDYNDADHPYPGVIRFSLVSQAIADENGFVPMKIVVSVMESMAPGNGTQNVLLKLDWDSLVKNEDEDTDFTPEVPEESSPALSVTDEKTGIKVEADKGVLDKGAQLKVTELTSGWEYENAEKALASISKKFKLFEIHFEDANGTELQPKGNVKVSYKIPEGFDKENVALYRINEDGTKTLVKGTVEQDYYVVYTKSFRVYALVEKENHTDTPDKTVDSDKDNGGNTVDSDKNNGGSTVDSDKDNNGNTTNSDKNNTENVANDVPATGENTSWQIWFMIMLTSAGFLGCIMKYISKRVDEG